MDNLEDKTANEMNSASENDLLRPDPIVRAEDDSGRSDEGIPTADIVPVRKTAPAAEATLLPEQFMRSAGPAQAGPSVNDIAESMWRYKWTILVIFILVAAPAIAAIWTLKTPQYRAKAELRIRPIIPYLVFRTEDNGAIPGYTSFVNTQVSIIRRPSVLNRVLDQPEIQETQWYKDPPKDLRQRLSGSSTTPLERLRDTLSVRPRGGTEITDVSIVAPNSKEAKLIVDTVLQQYQIYAAESSDESAETLYRQLVDQHKALVQEIDGLENTAAGFAVAFGTANPEKFVYDQKVRLDQTEEDISKLNRIISMLQWEINEANAVDSTELAGDVVERIQKQHRYRADSVWQKLELDIRTLKHQMANGIFKPKHPQMDHMVKDVEFAKESLLRRQAQLDEQWRDQGANAAGLPAPGTGADSFGPAGLSITVTGPGGLDATGLPAAITPPSNLTGEKKVAFLERQLARTIEHRDLLETDKKALETKYNDLSTTARMLENEKKKLQHKSELFTAVRQRLDQKTMERQVGGTISVLTNAIAPSQPYNDRRVVFTAMALVMGLGMGGGAAFLRASRSQVIHAPRDMPYPMQVPFLGYLPVARTEELLCDQVSPGVIESIRVVRTALLSRLTCEGRTTLLITSAAPGTGKSTFTIMLGESLAKTGKKVLLIDSDFQKMSLTKHFGLSDKPGFIQSLRRESLFRQHIYPSETSGLSIVPVGKRNNGGVAFEGISNGAFEACMDKLDKRYQIILLDGVSPILAAADSTILSSQVDGTIVVERELISRHMNLLSALTRLSLAGGHLLGTVFIGSDIRQKYGYGYHDSKNGES